MWHDGLFALTPVVNIGGIWFKREDEFSPDGVHNGSKFRQLIWLFSKRLGAPGVVSGAVTCSPQLPMVAACARHYGMSCVQFTGARKHMALAGEKLGAETILAKPGYGPLLNKRARDYAKEHGWLHVETNITSADAEPFHAVGAEQVRNLPDCMETLIVPAGSRNSVTSILYGLHRYPPQSLKRIILLNIAPSMKKKEEWMWARLKACGVDHLAYDLTTYDVFADGYSNYKKLMPCSYNGLHFHARYEAKCWSYLRDHLSTFRLYLNDKTVFWIVGSERSYLRNLSSTRVA